jgi:hypothetical protein
VDQNSRALLFAEKAKYITADTAWFVMVDPDAIVARPSQRGTNAASDIVLPFTGLTIDAFASALAGLHHEVAGVPRQLARFREGDEELIATERLSGSDLDATTLSVARNSFFDGLAQTTQALQDAAVSALAATRPLRSEIRTEVDAFEQQFNGFVFTPYPVGVQGRPQGREQTLAHGRAVHRLNRRLSQTPALARLALDAASICATDRN